MNATSLPITLLTVRRDGLFKEEQRLERVRDDRAAEVARAVDQINTVRAQLAEIYSALVALGYRDLT